MRLSGVLTVPTVPMERKKMAGSNRLRQWQWLEPAQ